MNLRSKKAFTGIEVIIAIAVIGALVAWQGPNLVKSVGTVFNGGDKNQAKIVHKVDSTRTLYQVDPQHPDKLIPVKETYSEYSNQSEAQQPPETLWQKFLHLGIMIIPIIAIISYLGAWPLVKKWVDSFKSKIAVVEAQHSTLQAQAIDIVQAIDDGWDAFDAQVKVYTEMMNTETDPTKKLNLLAVVTALQTARKAMKDKIYAELDNASLAKLGELQAAAPNSTVISV